MPLYVHKLGFCSVTLLTLVLGTLKLMDNDNSQAAVSSFNVEVPGK